MVIFNFTSFSSTSSKAIYWTNQSKADKSKQEMRVGNFPDNIGLF